MTTAPTIRLVAPGDSNLPEQPSGTSSDLPASANAIIPDPPAAPPATVDQASQVTTAPGDSNLPEQPSGCSSTSRDVGVIFNYLLTLANLACLAPFFCF